MKVVRISLVLLLCASCVYGGFRGAEKQTDPRNDAGPGWVDLVSVEVRGRNGKLEVEWTMAAAVPKKIPGTGLVLTVDLRAVDWTSFEVVANHIGDKRHKMQTVVRSFGPGPGRSDRVTGRPVVTRNRVVVEVPQRLLPGLQLPFTWTGTSYTLQPPRRWRSAS